MAVNRVVLTRGFRGTSLALLTDRNGLDVLLQPVDGLSVEIALVGCEAGRVDAEQSAMRSQRLVQQCGLRGLVFEHVVVGNELLGDLLNLNHVTELDRLAGLATL